MINESGVIEDIDELGVILDERQSVAGCTEVTLLGKKFRVSVGEIYWGLRLKVEMGCVSVTGKYKSFSGESLSVYVKFIGNTAGGFFGIRFPENIILKIFHRGMITGGGQTEYGEDLVFKSVDGKPVCEYYNNNIKVRQLKLNGIPYDDRGLLPYEKILYKKPIKTASAFDNRRAGVVDKESGLGEDRCGFALREGIDYKLGYFWGISARVMIIEKIILQAGIITYGSVFSEHLYSVQTGGGLVIYYKEFLRHWYSEEVIQKLRSETSFDNYFVKQNDYQMKFQKETEDFIIMRMEP